MLEWVIVYSELKYLQEGRIIIKINGYSHLTYTRDKKFNVKAL